MSKNGVELYGDSLFHINRVYEIRQSLLHFNLPTLVNLDSFFSVGQAINGMYPDISLWPFVLLTMWLPFKEQIVMIKVLILLLTILVTYFALNRRGYDKFASKQVAILYAFQDTLYINLLVNFNPELQLFTFFLLNITF